MDKKTVEEFVMLMNGRALDHGCVVVLVDSDKKGFTVRISEEFEVPNEDQLCRFEFVSGQKIDGADELLLRLVLLFNDKADGWLVSAAPAAAFAICWSGT